jgi:hypothetical protein
VSREVTWGWGHTRAGGIGIGVWDVGRYGNKGLGVTVCS